MIWRDFDQEVLGCHYRGYNPKSRQTGSDVWAAPEAREHPILKGWSRPASTARCGSTGRIRWPPPRPCSCGVAGRNEDPEEPVAWTNTRDGSRVFYTTLGHWDDFEIDAFNRLLENAIRWALASAGRKG